MTCSIHRANDPLGVGRLAGVRTSSEKVELLDSMMDRRFQRDLTHSGRLCWENSRYIDFRTRISRMERDSKEKIKSVLFTPEMQMDSLSVDHLTGIREPDGK